MQLIYKDKKKLYHIQGVTNWYSYREPYYREPYDMFVFLETEPSREQVKKLFIKDREIEDPEGAPEVRDFMESYNVYTVCADEI